MKDTVATGAHTPFSRRRKEMRALDKRIKELDHERASLLSERERLEIIEASERFTCECVRLNRDIDVHNMIDQEKCGRNGLQFGLVSNTFSALKACPKCHGRGHAHTDVDD